MIYESSRADGRAATPGGRARWSEEAGFRMLPVSEVL